MQEDFHYYATYCAAFLSGYSHEECLSIAYADQFTDVCSVTMLNKMRAPLSAATTQLQSELVNQRVDPVGLQEITRIWSSFHFLPFDLYAQHRIKSKRYLNKYRLICQPNGTLVRDTVKLAKGKGLPAVGIAMHVLSDTWAHSNFCGTPSLVINNTDDYFFELLAPEGEKRKISFNNNPATPDVPEKGVYTNSIAMIAENNIMNLGHGRAGHLPDYSFIRYEYMPAWMDYDVVIKDNPSDYYHAFCQMITAMLYLRGETEDFETGIYAFDLVRPYENRIRSILEKRQLKASADWKAFGEELSGRDIPDFDAGAYERSYIEAKANQKDATEAGMFILSAMAQKSMVTGSIFRSGNLLAGFAVDYKEKGFHGIRDYMKLVKSWGKEQQK